MIIRFLGAHNAESKDTKLVSFLIDDVLAVDAGSFASELSFSEQERIKAILLSHGHYDHIRGIPSFAFNNTHKITRIFAASETLGILSSHLIDGKIYPKFTEKNQFLKTPSLELIAMEPFKTIVIDDYHVLPIPVNHILGSLGFEIISRDGKKVFYTGDTGPGLSNVWKKISSQYIIIDLTFPNKLEVTAEKSMHLCPKMLKEEIKEFYRLKRFLPRVILIHLSSKFEEEIKEEIKKIATELKTSIDIASEGERFIV